MRLKSGRMEITTLTYGNIQGAIWDEKGVHFALEHEMYSEKGATFDLESFIHDLEMLHELEIHFGEKATVTYNGYNDGRVCVYYELEVPVEKVTKLLEKEVS